jgi:hypothetical protein
LITTDLAPGFAESVEYPAACLDSSHPKFKEWGKKNMDPAVYEDIWDAQCYRQMMSDQKLLGKNAINCL